MYTAPMSAKEDAHNLDDLKLRWELRKDYSSTEALAERKRFAVPTPEWIAKKYAPKKVDTQ